jgi:hypothetical protein
MKNLVIGIILVGILAIVLLFIIGISINNQNLTGKVANINTAPQSNQLSEQIIIDNEQQIKENIDYSQTFEISKPARVSVELISDELINYVLLPDYEIKHYANGENFESYTNQEIVFIKETYDLNVGRYSVVITSLDKPAEFHLIIKAI